MDDINKSEEIPGGSKVNERVVDPSDKIGEKMASNNKTPSKKRKRASWQKGLLKKRKRRMFSMPQV